MSLRPSALDGRVALLLVVAVDLFLALLDQEERRLGDVDVPARRSGPGHLAEEERQQQRADVRAVDVGVGHDDDLVVAQLREVELAPSTPAPSAVMMVRISSFASTLSMRAFSTFRILPLKRQDGLEAPVAALLGRAAGRVALDEEDLALRRVVRASSRPACRAASRRRGCSCAAPGRAPCAPPRGPAPPPDHLVDDLARRPTGSPRSSSRSSSSTMRSTMPLTSLLPSLVLVWPSNCGSRHLDRDHRGQALAHVLAAERPPCRFLVRPSRSA